MLANNVLAPRAAASHSQLGSCCACPLVHRFRSVCCSRLMPGTSVVLPRRRIRLTMHVRRPPPERLLSGKVVAMSQPIMFVTAAGSAFQKAFSQQCGSVCPASSNEDRAIDTDPLEARAEFTAAAAENDDEDTASPRNVWDSKPFWCQPWSIWATGMAAISFAWQASDSNLLITGLVTVPVFTWWYLFLFVMPASYAQYMEEIAAKGRGRQ